MKKNRKNKFIAIFFIANLFFILFISGIYSPSNSTVRFSKNNPILADVTDEPLISVNISNDEEIVQFDEVWVEFQIYNCNGCLYILGINNSVNNFGFIENTDLSHQFLFRLNTSQYGFFNLSLNVYNQTHPISNQNLVINHTIILQIAENTDNSTKQIVISIVIILLIIAILILLYYFYYSNQQSRTFVNKFLRLSPKNNLNYSEVFKPFIKQNQLLNRKEIKNTLKFVKKASKIIDLDINAVEDGDFLDGFKGISF